jgi:hypothetical protein
VVEKACILSELKELQEENANLKQRLQVSQPHNTNCFLSGLWIRIGSGFSDFVDPDPDPGARKIPVRNFSLNMHFLVFFYIYH